MKRSFLLPFLLLPLAGCGSILTTKTPAPVYYQPEHEPARVDCGKGFDRGVRVWELSAAHPYNRPEMVVTMPGGEVRFSSAYQWVASPGAMVADELARDLGTGNLFPLVVSGDNPLVVPLDLTGRVDRFAWVQENGAHAALTVETSLVEIGVSRKVLFRKVYDLRSGDFARDNSALFARAMGGLMARLSEELRRDLCQAAAGEPR